MEAWDLKVDLPGKPTSMVEGHFLICLQNPGGPHTVLSGLIFGGGTTCCEDCHHLGHGHGTHSSGFRFMLGPQFICLWWAVVNHSHASTTSGASRWEHVKMTLQWLKGQTWAGVLTSSLLVPGQHPGQRAHGWHLGENVGQKDWGKFTTKT